MLAENTLLKTARHFLLLLVGFDTLTYRKDYDRSPILVGHQRHAWKERRGAQRKHDRHQTWLRRDTDLQKEGFGTPLPGAPNVGFWVPAKPLRFEHWGAHEDLSPSSSRPHHDLKALRVELAIQRDTRFILVRATDVV